MKKRGFKKFLNRLMTGLLVTVLLGVCGFSATAQTTSQATVLENDVPDEGILPGSSAGSFTYYEIAYPGDEADLRVQLSFGPHDPVYGSALGFNVFGPDEYTGHGIKKADEGILELTYQDEEPASLLVQIYNYNANMTVSYKIVAKGLEVATSLDEEAEPAAPSSAPSRELETSVSNTIVGNTGGAFGLHPLYYEGTGEDVTVTMRFTPADPSFVNAFGFEVWDPEGEHVARGIAPAPEVLSLQKATFSSDVVGKFLVQVYNYSDGALMDYTLTVEE